MIPYKKDPKDSIRKLLKLINTFSKVAGHPINLLKNQQPSYAPMTDIQRKKLGQEDFCPQQPKNYFVMKLTKDMKDLYNENSKAPRRYMLKKILEDTLHVHLSEHSTLYKIAMPSKIVSM